jgi:hypothetical protein
MRNCGSLDGGNNEGGGPRRGGDKGERKILPFDHDFFRKFFVHTDGTLDISLPISIIRTNDKE